MSRHVADAGNGADRMPPADEIRKELARLVSDSRFEASERRIRFLEYVVTETVAGREGALKGTTLAMEVFGRDETFDPQTDPVVRIEARRLRRDLDSYYGGPGAAHPVRISIPKGGYAAEFELRKRYDGPPETDYRASPEKDAAPPVDPSPTSERAAARARAWTAALVPGAVFAVLAVAFAVWNARSPDAASVAIGGAPRIVVEGFTALDPSEMSNSLAVGLQSEIFNDLSRFDGLRLYMPLGVAGSAEPTELSAAASGAFVVMGNVHMDASSVDVQVQLVSAPSGEVLWSGAYSVPGETRRFVDVRKDISAQIATALGQPYGPIGANLQAEGHSGDAASSDSYLCVMRAYGYRRSFSRDAFAPTLACLEAAVARDPTYADAWAMLGWLYMDSGRFGFGDEDLETLYHRGSAAAERALELEPDSLLGLNALSAIRHYMGDYAVSQMLARRAVELNPYDPDTLAQLGWRLATRGNFEEGAAYLKEAIERSFNAPGWYYHLLMIEAYLAGDFEKMRALAELSVKDGSQFSYALLAVAAIAVEDPEGAEAAASHVTSDSLFRVSPEAFFRRHGATEEITERMSAGLDEAFARIAASAIR